MEDEKNRKHKNITQVLKNECFGTHSEHLEVSANKLLFNLAQTNCPSILGAQKKLRVFHGLSVRKGVLARTPFKFQ